MRASFASPKSVWADENGKAFYGVFRFHNFMSFNFESKSHFLLYFMTVKMCSSNFIFTTLLGIPTLQPQQGQIGKREDQRKQLTINLRVLSIPKCITRSLLAPIVRLRVSSTPPKILNIQNLIFMD